MTEPQIIMSLGHDEAAIAVAVDPMNGRRVLLVGSKTEVKKGLGAVLRSEMEANSLAAGLQAAAMIWKK